jgi:endonuclease/exonuclease/phosphatase family metal-dependent hydrolase
MSETRQPARFDPATRSWRPTVAAEPVRAELLSCVTFNVWFGEFAFDERCTTLLDLLDTCDADIVALQEVTPGLLDRVLEAPWVRERYAISDHTGQTIWPYGVLMLTRWTPQVFRLHPLPSSMGRRLLVAELELNGQRAAIATVHLESLRHEWRRRAQQLAQIFPLLEPAQHALLMGDLNFDVGWEPETRGLHPAYRDVWPAVHGDAPGYTVDGVRNLLGLDQHASQLRARFDRILLRSVASGWTPASIELLGTTPIHPARPRVFVSDHFGLLARIRIS